MNRQKIIVKTSIISIISNLLLSLFKFLIGMFSHSVAIISDSINNLSDALSSIITIVGTKLASKDPDRKHPFGHGRIEYITALIVSAIVIYAGLVALYESIMKIIHPIDVNYNFLTIIVLIMSIIVKFVLGLYVKYKGKEVNSDSLFASGLDAFNDAIISISVLITTILYLTFKIRLDAYVGIVLGLIIIKSGIELIKQPLNNMVGMSAKEGLSKKIKHEILSIESVEGVFDLLLHNYGPDTYIGSVHIEIKDTYTVNDIDRLSRTITDVIKKKYSVIIHTVGVYSINTKSKKVSRIRQEIEQIVFSYSSILEFHGFYLDEENKTISFDIIIDYKEKYKDKIYKSIYDKIKTKYPDYTLLITLDVDVSD